MHGAERPDSTYFLRKVADHVPSMLAYWGRDLKCRFANQAYKTWFGVPPEKIIGLSIAELLGPELFALNEPYIRGVLGGCPQSFERIVPGADGVQRHSLAQYTPDVVDGQVIGFVASVSEVTPLKKSQSERDATIRSLQAEIEQRRAVEVRLEDTQQSLAVTLASIDAGYIATDKTGRVVRMNSVSEQVTGWPQAQALGRSLWEVFVREDRPPELTTENPVAWLEAHEMGANVAHHVMAVARDGTRTPLEVKAALTYTADGAVRGLVIVLRDVSSTWSAQLESNRLAAIVESSTDAIISKSLDGRITGWNRAAQAMFGYTATEAIGQPVQMLIPPDRLQEEMAILATLARGQSVEPFETIRMAKDGRAIEVSVSISPIRDAAGRVAGASKIARDISQTMKARRLDAENRRIQEASRLKSLFLANMSHELRTPLNAIIGFADLLLAGAAQGDPVKNEKFLGHIASSGRHLLQLISDVLDLSKVEAGKFEFFPAPVDLPQLIKEVSDVLRASMDRKGIAFSSSVDPDLGCIELDPGRLKQVLYNYLSNAIKFSPEGGSVHVRALAEGALHFRLEVEDRGIGIATDQLPLLFTEFQQLDAGYTRRYEGTGLGLALTRRLVEAQGGSVGVVSQAGCGSVFHALLNRIHGTDLARTRQSLRGRLLLIEDDPALRGQALAALNGAGYQVTAAATAREASTQARTDRFDGLTLDMCLPDCRGLSLLSDIRGVGASHAAPVLAVTMPADAGTAASFAISDILCKPIQAQQLAAAMKPFGLLGGRKVIVIDDDPAALDLMRASLQAIGIGVVCFDDGRRALSELDIHQPQAIILDLIMPDFDGFAVLDGLRRLERWRDLPVFIWTSMVLTEDDYARLSRSAVSILRKGGGDLAVMLESLLRWRPPATV